LVDGQAAIPFLIIALGALAIFGNSLTLFLVIVAIQGWEIYARIARGLALSAGRQGYVVAVRMVGARPGWLYLRHILPNISSALIVNLTLSFSGTILLESSISFVGLGIQPPLSSLGSMLGYGRQYVLTAWWLSVLPGAMIFSIALA